MRSGRSELLNKLITAGVYLFVVLFTILHPTHELEPPANQARFKETAAARIAPPKEASPPEPKQKPKRKPLPPELPRNEQVLRPGKTYKCGGDLRSLGEDVT